MSKSLKFPKNRNKNVFFILTQPGPGDYEIPTSIGKLPKYYCGPKKLTNTGFSTHAIAMTERTQRLKEEQRIREERLKQEEQARLKKQEENEEEAQG